MMSGKRSWASSDYLTGLKPKEDIRDKEEL